MGRGSSSRNKQRQHAPPATRTQPLTIGDQQAGPDGVLVQRHMMALTSYSGPTPPVEVLEGYERIAPGSAKQILDQFIKQSDHRMRLESNVIASDIIRSWGGLIAGLIVALSFLGGGVAAILSGHDTAGATLATSSIIGLVGVFVYGTRSQRKEREQKAKLTTEVKKRK